jgi:hypothetical protein
MTNARVLTLFIATALCACHGDPDPSPESRPTPRSNGNANVKKGPTAQELTVGMVEAASLGKSQVPVELKFDVLQRPAVGHALEVALALLPQIAASPATLQLTGSDGLTLAAGSGTLEIPSVETAAVYRRTVKLTPSAEGMQFLDVTVTLKHDEMSESREFSVPLIVAANPR